MMPEIWGPPFLLLLAGLYYWLAIYPPGAQQEWESLPERDVYRDRHGGLVCRCCGAQETLDTGLLRHTDFRRRIVCAHCKTPLWREEER
ncbi:hypothetical protein [Chitinilyticum litopenaei]|uniref:hypothetical protein n=1 Tax=Chitinilyticum litopenaei TaxID=1121276 RepID=UPI0006878459|nr:hypothetical protein [Chitinilyticum litopenaei]